MKRIFIEEDGDIAQCMLENGALMLLSIDGKMAVDLEDTTAETAKEDTVTVTLSDGTQVEGTVEETDGTSCTITMTDSGVGMDDTAVVTNEQGVELGTGTVYIHQQLEVTGSMGTVTEIQVAEDEAVESDETLLTLASSEETAEYQSLLASHTALANRLTELLVLSQDGYIKADMQPLSCMIKKIPGSLLALCRQFCGLLLWIRKPVCLRKRRTARHSMTERVRKGILCPLLLGRKRLLIRQMRRLP